MKIWAISDLHLSFACDKPMDIFGGNWENYTQKIAENWKALVNNDDIVLIAGDISWAMKLDEAKADLQWIDNLPGKKIIIKGNHELWWSGITTVRNALPDSIWAIQNDCMRVGNILLCGTRGWTVPEHGKQLPAEDDKIYKREVIRLGLTLEAMKKQRKPEDKVICMMHFPPFNMTKEDSEFTKLLDEYNVDIVVYGHLHGKLVNMDKVYIKNNTKYFFTATDHINNTPVEICETN